MNLTIIFFLIVTFPPFSRTYSQVSKISIEELGPGNGRFASPFRPSAVVIQEEPASERATYFVDEDPPTESSQSRPSYMNRVNDASAYRQGDSNNNIRFKISEITDETEQMEL